MCIIVSKEKGKKLPTKKTLQRCFDYNNDGAGLMYVKDNKVVIEKGFMTFNNFYNRLKELKQEFGNDLQDKALVMHFRIGTSGVGDTGLTHPFPLSNKVKDLNSTYITTNVGITHNGIISNYVYGKLSDTQNYIKDFMYPLYQLNKNFYRKRNIRDILESTCKSKLCILDKNEKIYYVGEFIEDDGIMYSNSTYQQVKYTYYNYGRNNIWWDYETEDYDKYYEELEKYYNAKYGVYDYDKESEEL